MRRHSSEPNPDLEPTPAACGYEPQGESRLAAGGYERRSTAAPRGLPPEISPATEDLRSTISLLTATLESTADGILVVGLDHKISLYNQRFLEMWRIPPEVLGGRSDESVLAFVLDQLVDPQGFVARVEELYQQPDAESFEVIEFKDGRTFERYSRPQRVDGRPNGRVWSFRDMTARLEVEEALRESDQKFRAAFDQSPIALTLLSTPDHKIVEINDACLSTLGYRREELPLLNAGEHAVWPRTDLRDRYFDLLRETGSVRDFEVVLRRRSGELIVATLNGSLVRLGGQTFSLNSMLDMTERKRSEAMREALHQISEAVHSSLDLPALFARIHQIIGGLLPARNFFVALYDERTDEVSFPYFVDETDPRPAPRRLGSGGLTEIVLRGGQSLLLTPASRELTCDGRAFGTMPLDWLGVPLRSPTRTLGALVVQSYSGEVRYTERDMELLEVVSDQVTLAIERKQAQERLQHDALHDELTGLPNRTLFLDRLRHAMARARRRPQGVTAVLFLDLDRFKQVNDSLGHLLGDQVLVRVAATLSGALRPVDTIARIGGDEFAVLLEDVQDVAAAEGVAERLLQSLTPPILIGRRKIYSSASIGLAVLTPEYRRPENLLRHSDTAMYRAKSAGGACCVVFNRAMHRRVIARRRMEADLRRAIEGGQLRIHYQPFVDLENGGVVGFEALMRWQHPQRGLRPPADFLDIAEQTGILVPFGRYVLSESCRRIRELQQLDPQGPPLKLTVNLSHKQFFATDLFDQIRGALSESGLDPSCLGLEITESVVIDHLESATRRFARLKSMGVQLYLDDFGKGYSALNYLHLFPMDILKIDRSFIARIAKAERNLAIVRAIVTLGQQLNMQVVAEGIETTEQQVKLRSLGCDYGQGFLFSRPVPADRMEEVLARQRPPLAM